MASDGWTTLQIGIGAATTCFTAWIAWQQAKEKRRSEARTRRVETACHGLENEVSKLTKVTETAAMQRPSQHEPD